MTENDRRFVLALLRGLMKAFDAEQRYAFSYIHDCIAYTPLEEITAEAKDALKQAVFLAIQEKVDASTLDKIDSILAASTLRRFPSTD